MFKKKHYCNNHNALEELQTLSKELKIKEEQLKEEQKIPISNYDNYDDNTRYFYSHIYADHLANSIALLLKNPKIHTLSSFYKEIKGYLPSERTKYMRDLGLFFLQMEEQVKKIDEIEKQITELKKKIEKTKERLEII